MLPCRTILGLKMGYRGGGFSGGHRWGILGGRQGEGEGARKRQNNPIFTSSQAHAMMTPFVTSTRKDHHEPVERDRIQKETGALGTPSRRENKSITSLGPPKKKQELWEHRLVEFHKSNLGPTEYCRAKGYSPSQFFYWKKKIEAPPCQAMENTKSAKEQPLIPSTIGKNPETKAPPSPTAIQLVQLQAPSPCIYGSGPAGVLLHIGNRYRIEFQKGFDASALELILQVLEAL